MAKIVNNSAGDITLTATIGGKDGDVVETIHLKAGTADSLGNIVKPSEPVEIDDKLLAALKKIPAIKGYFDTKKLMTEAQAHSAVTSTPQEQ